jgi:tetratricopeptide (TPR) repeat protein
MNTKRLEQLINMKKEEPNDPFLIYAIAMEYAKIENFDESIAHYEQLVNEHEDYVGTYYHLAKLYETLKMPDKADVTYQKGLAVSKKIADHHAHSELLSAYNSFKGIGIDDDDEY